MERVKRRRRGQECVEGGERGEEALLLRGPREGFGVLPALAALSNAERPIEQVAHVGEDRDGAAAGAVEVGKVGGRVFEGARGAVGQVANVWRRVRVFRPWEKYSSEASIR